VLVFNNLPPYIKHSSDSLKRIILKQFLNAHSFCIRRNIIPYDTFGR